MSRPAHPMQLSRLGPGAGAALRRPEAAVELDRQLGVLVKLRASHPAGHAAAAASTSACTGRKHAPVVPVGAAAQLSSPLLVRLRTWRPGPAPLILRSSARCLDRVTTRRAAATQPRFAKGS